MGEGAWVAVTVTVAVAVAVVVVVVVVVDEVWCDSAWWAIVFVVVVGDPVL